MLIYIILRIKDMSEFFTTIELPKIGLSFASENKPIVDVDNRTVKFIASDETPVSRFDWWNWELYNLILSHDPKHVNLQRVKSRVCMLLTDHYASFEKQLGRITKAEFDNKKLLLTAKIHDEELGNKYLKRVENDTAPGNSVGIDVYKMEVIKKAKFEIDEETGRKKLKEPATMRAIDWELLECSSVSIPANPNASFTQKDKEEFDKLPKHQVYILGDPGYDPETGKERKEKSLFSISKPVKQSAKKKGKEMSDKIDLANMSEDELRQHCLSQDERITTLEKDNSSKDAKIAELTQKLQKIESDRQTLNQYRGLISQANKLMTEAKLTKAEFEQRFSLSEEDFANTPNTDINLIKLSAYLEACEARQPMLNTQLKVTNQPNSIQLSEEDDTSEADNYLAQTATKSVKSY